jgi:FKBP-type peptidyl-prolyl cis-trans isomerase|tara:strand:+ start:1110 stop:2102 length:993 start_codon:yes stop_codon:yes gene_type:complete
MFACNDTNNDLEDGLYAEFDTTMGVILVKLTYEKTPVTVANFVALAEGNHPKVREEYKGIKFYDGLIFHRVINNFMIQGGDPVGNGSGGPGYKFLDEFDQSLLHDKSGVLSMANSGPGTNGSQFFITEVPTPHLDFKHSVFGQVVKGIEIQDEISNVKTAIANRPEKDIIIKKLTIIRKGSKAKKFDAVETWNEMEPKLLMIQQQKAQDEIDRISKGFTTTDSGLKYKINKPSDGANAKNGDKVRVHYSGKLTNGSEFDSSFKRNKPFEFIVGEGRVIKGWDEALKILKLGENATFVIPSNLGYGARGAGGVIPPNATLVFEIELLEILD